MILIICQISYSQTYKFSSINKILKDSINVFGGGAAFSIVKGDSVLFRQGYGNATNNLDTIIPIASATKWISAAVIMDMIDDNLLSINDTIGTYLPFMTKNGKGNRTVGECFSHTAGMKGSTPYLRDTGLTLEICVDSIAQEIYNLLALPAGTKFYYGGLSMQTVGFIAEVVENKSWDSIFTQRIASPLQMKNTNYNAYGETDNPHIGGGLTSNLSDIENFLKYLLNYGKFNNQIITDSVWISEMEQDYLESKPLVYSPYSNLGNIDPALPNTGYGFGVWRMSTSQDTIPEFVSQGAYGFTFWINRECNYGAVLAVYENYVNIMPTFLKLKKELKNIMCSNLTTTEEVFNKENINIYPNPANNYLHIQIENNIPFKLNVYDALGRIIFTNDEIVEYIEINTNSFLKGIYFLEITYKNDRWVSKFIKE